MIRKTPLYFSDYLSKFYKANIILKREDLQVVRSFKIRGAYNKIKNSKFKNDIVTASAGNHAQGVAYVCNQKKINHHIFIPQCTPKQKIDRIKYFGGENLNIYVVDSTLNEVLSMSNEFAKENNFKVSIDEIIKKVSKKTKIVFLANPNNPTGTYLNKTELIRLRKKLNKRILLVLDDAYFEYMENKDYISGLDIFKKKNNVIILRTFSKIYGLASLRIGWGYGPKKIIDAMYQIKPPFNVNKMAQLAAIESLKDKNFIRHSIKHNNFWAKKIHFFLKDFGIKTNKVSANFFLLNFDNCRFSANYVLKKLQSKGIILRSTKDGYNIKNKLRLTIGSTKENLKFIKIIKIIFGKK